MLFERFYDKPIQNIVLAIRTRKIKWVLFGALCGLTIIAVRLFYLQSYQNRTLYSLGERNCTKTEVIPSKRGNILDCNNNLLATNRPVFDLYWHGGGAPNLTSEQKDTLQKMSLIFGDTVIDALMCKKIERGEKFSRNILIKNDLSPIELSQVSEQCASSNNVFVDRHYRRIYPYDTLASHVLGYIRKAEDVWCDLGKSGLEKIFQADLQGEHGYIKHMVNATGRRLLQKEIKEAIAGQDLHLTLDLGLQNIVEELFEPGQSGAFIIMDPEDGAIRAMLSYPNFDPNSFLGPISDKDWHEKFSVDSPMLNRTINAVYPPASIFKLITFVAGLEEGLISTDSRFYCQGHTVFCGRRYHCHLHSGHGYQSAHEALGNSCNIPCYDVAQRISIDQLAAYAMRFGLGQSTQFVFGDKVGLVPTSYWKQLCKGEKWRKGETLSASIGQTFWLVTPLQVIRMVAAICAGYLVKPRILQNEEVEKMPLYVSEHARKFLREVMHQTVLYGTAHRLSIFSNFEIHAKTGTAQTVSLKKQKKELKNQLEHAWFASYFSYKNSKPLAMVILMENVGSSSVALRVAEKFFRHYQNYLHSAAKT